MKLIYIPTPQSLKSGVGDETTKKGHFKSFHRFEKFASGAFGEASRDLHTFVRRAATISAERFYRNIGARNKEEAMSTYVTRYRRELGMQMALQQAILKRERLNMVLGGDFRKASVTRAQGRSWSHKISEDYQHYFGGGFRGFREHY